VGSVAADLLGATEFKAESMGEHGAHALTAAVHRRIHDEDLTFSAHSAPISAVADVAARDSTTPECNGEPRRRPSAGNGGNVERHRVGPCAATSESPLITDEPTDQSRAVA
jgi:hypothetical protein